MLLYSVVIMPRNEGEVPQIDFENHPNRIGLLRIAGGLAYLNVEESTIAAILNRASIDYEYLLDAAQIVSASVLSSVNSGERPALFEAGGPFYVGD
jgi:hypothetical protein